MMKLTAENVHTTFLDCLFQENENKDNPKIGDGVKMKVGFNAERLEKYRNDVVSMLDELPDSFKKSGGGGMSFLNMCEDKNKNLWTGTHQTMDELVILGNALGIVSFLMPKEMWNAFPGGMPYLVIS